MVQIDLPFAFGSAGLFAAAVEQGLRSNRASYFYARALTVNLLFQIALVVWFPLYLLVNQFGMQTSHMWWHGDSITDYPLLLPLFFVAYFAANVGGFHLGATLVRRGRTRTVWAIFFLATIFMFGWMAAQPYRTLSLGTYREWEAGTARWIWTHPLLFAAVLGEFVLFFAVLALLYRRLKREAMGAIPG